MAEISLNANKSAEEILAAERRAYETMREFEFEAFSEYFHAIRVNKISPEFMQFNYMIRKEPKLNFILSHSYCKAVQ